MAQRAALERVMTVRTAAQIREALLEACAERQECDDCYLGGVVRIDPDSRGRNWALRTTPFGDNRDACVDCTQAIATVLERLRDTVILPPTDLTVREIESLQTILATRELGRPPSASSWQPQLAVERGYAYVASDGRLDVSRTGRELLRRL
jgi:hypothetical protein